MQIVVKATSTRGFAGKSNKIKRDLIGPSIQHIQECQNFGGLRGKEFDRETGARIDITEETRTEAGKKESVLKLQVQNRSDTYSSIIIRESAIHYGNGAGAVEMIEWIMRMLDSSYEDQTVYEISYE